MKNTQPAVAAGLILFSLLVATPSAADEVPPHPRVATHQHVTAVGHEKHARMLAAMGESPVYARSEHAYPIPDVALVDENRRKRSLTQLFDSEAPVVMNFIYTSCPTVCPVLSATLAEAQPALMQGANPPVLVSISIDPAYDTPERLQRYAEKFNAGDRWHFLTGSGDSVEQTQRAFDAYRGDKSNHIPLTFIRKGRGSPWVRLEGFTSAASLIQEYGRIVGH